MPEKLRDCLCIASQDLGWIWIIDPLEISGPYLFFQKLETSKGMLSSETVW